MIDMSIVRVHQHEACIARNVCRMHTQELSSRAPILKSPAAVRLPLIDAVLSQEAPPALMTNSSFGGLAEFERELILARTGAGRDRAKAQGVRFGRPPSLTPHQRREAMERLAQGAAQAELARSYGVSQSTISRLAASSPFEASVVAA
jgi:DNA invertase Pin-like site-specific DNA recombinase